MLSILETDEIATRYINKLSTQCQTELVILSDLTITESRFRVYFYQSKEFIRSGNPSSQLAGNAPFIVDNLSGKVTLTGTAQELEFYLIQYREGKIK